MFDISIKYFVVVGLLTISSFIFVECQSFNLKLVENLDIDTKKFLMMNCNQKESVVLNKRAIPSYKKVYLSCVNLNRATVNFRLCGECINPFNCKKLQRLRSKAIYWQETISDNHGNNFSVRLPIGCQCVKDYWIESTNYQIMYNCCIYV